jgi:hypothetical protein
MSFYQDFKSLYQSYILLFIILLFVIVYIVINWSVVKDGDYFGGEYTRPILITAIIFLMLHMLITWDDNVVDSDNEIIDLPKYKFKYSIDNVIKNDIIGTNQINRQISTNIQTLPTNNITQNVHQEQIIPHKSNLIDVQSLNNKYRVVNKFDNNINNNIDANIDATSKLNNFINNYSNDSKLSNQHIFISHKNSSKYGLKF